MATIQKNKSFFSFLENFIRIYDNINLQPWNEKVDIFTLPMRCFDWYVCSICLFDSTFVSIYFASVAMLAALRVALPCYFSFVFGCWRTNHVLIKVKISYDKLTHLKSYGGTIFGSNNTHSHIDTYIFYRVHLLESSFGQRLLSYVEKNVQ